MHQSQNYSPSSLWIFCHSHLAIDRHFELVIRAFFKLNTDDTVKLCIT